MIFSERGTAESRLSSATLNPQKMINWLFMCLAIIKYTEYNQQKIITSPEKITFTGVLNHYREFFKGDKTASFLSEYLIAYYEEKCRIFARDFKEGDYVSNHDLTKDKKYSFTYKGVTRLF